MSAVCLVVGFRNLKPGKSTLLLTMCFFFLFSLFREVLDKDQIERLFFELLCSHCLRTKSSYITL